MPVKKSYILIIAVLCLIIISANFSFNFDVAQQTEQTVHTAYPKPIGIRTHDRPQKSDAKTVQDNVDRQHKTTTKTTPDADVTDDDMINLAKLYEEIDVVETSFDNNYTQFEKSKRLSSSYVTARLLGFQREISNCNSSLYQTDQLKVENPLVYGV